MPQKILIVDDDQEFRSELKDFLQGYDVIEAASGRETIDLLKRAHDIGLVILDVNMPGVNGLDVLKEIKRTEPGLNIIILTGLSSKDVAIEALKGHADDYIEKPLDLDKIQAIIERIFQAKSKEPQFDTSSLKGKIEKMKYLAQVNCYKKTCLNDVARMVCLSPKYLSRIFKQEAGLSFSEYRLRLKTEKAKQLLVKTNLNVNQISDKLGYENTESFIRQFKKRTEATPTEFRKKANKKKIKNKKK